MDPDGVDRVKREVTVRSSVAVTCPAEVEVESAFTAPMDDPDMKATVKEMNATQAGVLAQLYADGKKGRGRKFTRILHNAHIARFMRELEVREQDVWLLFQVFENIDKDKSGTVDLHEFFEYCDMDFTPFAARAFAARKASCSLATLRSTSSSSCRAFSASASDTSVRERSRSKWERTRPSPPLLR